MLLNLLEKMGRKRIIYNRDGINALIVRYYIAFKPKGKGSDSDYDARKNHTPFNAFIHNMRESDMPVLHSHPWPWMSLVLSVGYWEHLADGTRKWRKPWSVVFRKATDYHWIELEPGTYPWTLFIHGKRKRKWGFLVDGKEIYWKDFIASIRA